MSQKLQDCPTIITIWLVDIIIAIDDISLIFNCFKYELVIRIALSVDDVTQIDNFDHINQLPEWVRVNYQA